MVRKMGRREGEERARGSQAPRCQFWAYIPPHRAYHQRHLHPRILIAAFAPSFHSFLRSNEPTSLCPSQQVRAQKGSKKAVTKTAGKGGKKRRKSRKESYAIYVYKVLKQVHPTPASPPRPWES
ncbi:hypothetical protein DPEC_G00069570 [Dallia pectoralis]|uniref:Uncharacterized protein n=1 Tax=Dallia pectoralis TaxID=75939 RepID=A0ACC2H2H6_DALPE|nr:hypothetical protein DPEC_G00069570 [Dallia pectoralis]